MSRGAISRGPFPQLRRDPIVERWVLVAPERATRPMELTAAAGPRERGPCPFCEGEEARTPHEVYAIRRPGTAVDGPGWQVRVVSNLFPAARGDAAPVSAEKPFVAEPGYGWHEVVIEWPDHQTSLAELPVDHVRTVLAVYRARMSAMSADPQLKHVQVFKNHGLAAGASVEHVHSQILAVSRIPRELEAEMHGAADHFRRQGSCAFCDLLRSELSAGQRVVDLRPNVAAIAAYAGRFPFETWIMPRRHSSSFRDADDEQIADLAVTLHGVLRRLEQIVPDVGYNLVLHTAPIHDAERPDYHWHWELLPRTTGIAGFELSTGWFVYPVHPVVAAAQMRGEP